MSFSEDFRVSMQAKKLQHMSEIVANEKTGIDLCCASFAWAVNIKKFYYRW
jgi:hypothetical protein